MCPFFMHLLFAGLVPGWMAWGLAGGNLIRICRSLRCGCLGLWGSWYCSGHGNNNNGPLHGKHLELLKYAVFRGPNQSLFGSVARAGHSPMGKSFKILAGLAERWEEDIAVRRRARELRQLVQWTKPNMVGVASLRPSCNLSRKSNYEVFWGWRLLLHLR